MILASQAEKLFVRLQDEFLLPEPEARSYAEQFRPHLAAPVDPEYLHGSEVFERLDEVARRQTSSPATYGKPGTKAGDRHLHHTLAVLLVCLTSPGGYTHDRSIRPIGL